MGVHSPTAPASASRARTAAVPRGALWVLGLATVAGLVYLMATAETGPADPTEVHQSHGTAVFNASIIVFREGL
jgi:high-affinity iron transporter